MIRIGKLAGLLPPCLLLFGAVLGLAQGPAREPLLLKMAAPARVLEEALPTGNGRLGASLYGGVMDERVSLNESSMWSGSRHDSDRPDAARVLPEIRRLLLAGKNVEAEALVNLSFTSADKGSSDPRFGRYEELGRLMLHFEPASAEISDYHRELDLDGAVASMSFTSGGVHFRREVFSSAADQVVVVHLTADRAHALSFRASLLREERFQTEAAGSHSLTMTGELDSGAAGVAGVRYAAGLQVLAPGGNVVAEGSSLRVSGANEVVLLLGAATNYDGFAGRHTLDPAAAVARDLKLAESVSYASLLARHQADYQRYFRRVSLTLGTAAGVTDARPAFERLKAANAGAADPELAALYFQYGRYLLISSSRPGGLPANLQGLWSEGVHPAWNCDWHLNVNVQMNYWPAESTGLSELTQPLFALIDSLREPGAKTAARYYGAPGWVAHVITNPWGYTSPGEQASWGSTMIGSGWLCQHLWAHYQYTGDRQFLRQAYPAMKGAAEFYLAMLVAEPKHGWLVTAPSNSPENTFYLPDGQKASVAMGPAIDEEILRFLFGATAEAGRTLHLDAALQGRLRAAAARLAPLQIGPDGRLMEWLEPYREVDPHHRHVSHLWALYPGQEIDARATPELALAARKSLEVRGDGATGWSLAFKMLLWTRLGDGDHAYALLRNLWHPVDPIRQGEAGSFPNLWDAHPPFQIDGNFGATASIAEMLLQSRTGELSLLPALPSAWPQGRVTGLQAQGGVTASLEWTGGHLQRATLRSVRTQSVTVRFDGRSRSVMLPAGRDVSLDAD